MLNALRTYGMIYCAMRYWNSSIVQGGGGGGGFSVGFLGGGGGGGGREGGGFWKRVHLQEAVDGSGTAAWVSLEPAN